MQKFKKDKALRAIFTSFSHTHHGANTLNLRLVKHGGAANSEWQVFAGKTTRDKFGSASVEKMVLVGETMCGSIANSARRKWGSACGRSGQSENGAVWVRDFSLSLSLSRCSHFLARLWAKFKGLFYSFCRSFISLYCRFCLFYRNFILFCRSFFSSFCLQKAFFRTFCLFEIFKCFVFGLFALVIASRFCENGVAIHKFSVIFAFWIATLVLLACNDGETLSF